MVDAAEADAQHESTLAELENLAGFSVHPADSFTRVAVRGRHGIAEETRAPNGSGFARVLTFIPADHVAVEYRLYLRDPTDEHDGISWEWLYAIKDMQRERTLVTRIEVRKHAADGLRLPRAIADLPEVYRQLIERPGDVKFLNAADAAEYRAQQPGDMLQAGVEMETPNPLRIPLIILATIFFLGVLKTLVHRPRTTPTGELICNPD